MARLARLQRADQDGGVSKQTAMLRIDFFMPFPDASKLAPVQGMKKPTFSRFALRRRRDSNSRYSFPYTHFPGVLLQPLGHVS